MSGFDVYGAQQSEVKKQTSNVDFNALNDYVIKTVDCENPATWNGYISCIVDLGTQKQPDAEYDLDESDVGMSVEDLTEKYSEEISKGVISKFGKSYDSKTRSWIVRKFVPQDDRQSFVYAVDFPDIMLNKGKFFNEENQEEKPLRLWSGGQYWHADKKKMFVQNFIPLKVKNISEVEGSKVWSMGLTSLPHKMAVAAGIVKKGEAFLPQQLDLLLGKTMQFEVQIFNKEGNGGKKYYTEKLKFVGAIQKKDKPFENVAAHLIQFNKPNDPEALKELRKHIINTIENATNFEGSVIQKELLEVRPQTFAKGDDKPTQPKVAVTAEDDLW